MKARPGDTLHEMLKQRMKYAVEVKPLVNEELYVLIATSIGSRRLLLDLGSGTIFS